MSKKSCLQMEAERHFYQVDQVLYGRIQELGPCHIDADSVIDPFAAGLRSIIGQQLSVLAARAIHKRVLQLLEKNGGVCTEVLLQVPIEDLREAGMSRAKIRTIREWSEKLISGEIPPPDVLATLTDQQVIDVLTQVWGMGPWSAKMLLIFDMGRLDVLPDTDLGIRKGVQRLDGLMNLPSDKEVVARARCWQPYRSIASWYLWRLIDPGDVDW